MITLEFDSEAFRLQFKKRVLRSKRTIAEVTNEVAFQILRAAMKRTPRANRTEIEALGISYETMNKKGTRALKRRRAVIDPTNRFKLIFLKNLWRYGPKPRTFANAAAIAEAAKKKLGRRSSSVGSIASGWMPALRALLHKIHGANLSTGEGRTFKWTHGSGTPASDGSWSPEVIIENATGMNAPHQSSASVARVESDLTTAWQVSLQEETNAMWRYEKKLEAALHDD